jgi:hypothetical protein
LWFDRPGDSGSSSPVASSFGASRSRRASLLWMRRAIDNERYYTTLCHCCQALYRLFIATSTISFLQRSTRVIAVVSLQVMCYSTFHGVCQESRRHTRRSGAARHLAWCVGSVCSSRRLRQLLFRRDDDGAAAPAPRPRHGHRPRTMSRHMPRTRSVSARP